ncbi:hypothetical protein OsI_20533 [Oryza sativa Indica Group]|uniref:Uncharacterized protein n=1 Tax=Oryza sativa subsp. indica TaxID=39946 RepID=A2Y6A2_ORYSI|nr:hypothetical protein OsI_20533 [Oryza sativa Indica Group]
MAKAKSQLVATWIRREEERQPPMKSPFECEFLLRRAIVRIEGEINELLGMD